MSVSPTPSGRPSPSHRRDGHLTTQNKPLRLPGILVGLTIFSSVWLNIGPKNVSPVDVMLGVLLVAYLPAVWSVRNARFQELARQIGPPILAYLLLGLLLLTFVGGTWLTLFKDAVSFSYFFIVLAVLLKTRRTPDLRPAFLGLYAGLFLLVGATLTVGEGSRATGFGRNANTPAIWLAEAAILLLITGRPKNLLLRSAMISMAAFALLQTSSMGGLTALVAGAVYFLIARGNHPMPVQLTATGLAAGLSFLLLPYLSSITKVTRETGVDRLDRSQSSRQTLWTAAWENWLDNPMGMGPGGFANAKIVTFTRNGFETHNDYIGILTDYGLIGLVIFLILLYRLFMASPRTRPFVVTMAVWSATHGGINMRSSWIFLGLALAWEYWDKRNAEQNAHDPPGIETSDATQSVVTTDVRPRWAPPRPQT